MAEGFSLLPRNSIEICSFNSWNRNYIDTRFEYGEESTSEQSMRKRAERKIFH